MKREAIAAGQFYPGNKTELESTLNKLFSEQKIEPCSIAVVSPHAGYSYSGRLAAKSISKLKKARTIIILGPNHTGLGAPISISPHSVWKTPLGEIEVDLDKAKGIAKEIGELDELAHIGEHSIEVILPFLQHRFKDFKILPITLASGNLEELLELGKILSQLEDVSLVASGDFSHFIPESTAREKDSEAIELIERLKAVEFFNLVKENQLSICGVAPITAAIEFACRKGLKQAVTLEYASSAEITGDKSNVVGYASIEFE